MVFLVEKDVRVKGRRACDCLNHEEIDRQYEVCTRPYQNTGMKKKGVLLPPLARYVRETR